MRNPKGRAKHKLRLFSTRGDAVEEKSRLEEKYPTGVHRIWYSQPHEKWAVGSWTFLGKGNPTPKEDVQRRKYLISVMRKLVQEGKLPGRYLSGSVWMDTQSLEDLLKRYRNPARIPGEPWSYPLSEYQDLREAMGTEARRRRPISYGVHSADAFLNRYKRYEKEHLLSVRDAILRGERVPVSRFREHKSLVFPKPIGGVRHLGVPKSVLRGYYLQRLRGLRNPFIESMITGLGIGTGFAAAHLLTDGIVQRKKRR